MDRYGSHSKPEGSSLRMIPYRMLSSLTNPDGLVTTATDVTYQMLGLEECLAAASQVTKVSPAAANSVFSTRGIQLLCLSILNHMLSQLSEPVHCWNESASCAFVRETFSNASLSRVNIASGGQKALLSLEETQRLLVGTEDIRGVDGIGILDASFLTVCTRTLVGMNDHASIATDMIRRLVTSIFLWRGQDRNPIAGGQKLSYSLNIVDKANPKHSLYIKKDPHQHERSMLDMLALLFAMEPFAEVTKKSSLLCYGGGNEGRIDPSTALPCYSIVVDDIFCCLYASVKVFNHDSFLFDRNDLACRVAF